MDARQEALRHAPRGLTQSKTPAAGRGQRQRGLEQQSMPGVCYMKSITISPTDPALKRARQADVSTLLAQLGFTLKRGTMRCPFADHQDRTPSFSVFVGRDGRSHWRCHGCGRHGDALGLLRQLRGLDFREAVRVLAK